MAETACWDLANNSDDICFTKKKEMQPCYNANKFPFMYSQKRFGQASLLISTK